MLYKLISVQNTGTCYPGLGWICQVRLGSLFPCGFGWELCRTAIAVSYAIVNCNQNEAGQQTIKAPSMHCWGAASPWKHFLVHFKHQDWWNWQIKLIKSVSVGSYQYKNQVNEEIFAYLWVILLYFSLESRLIPALLELGTVKLFWILIRSIIWQLHVSHSCQSGVWEYFPSSLALK